MENNYPVYEITNKTKKSYKSNIDIYKDQPGVWMLCGKEKINDKKWVCLQVAQNKNIGEEMLSDMEDLTKKNPVPKHMDYVNQFGEQLFEYDNYNGFTAKVLYHKIAKNYNDLWFCVIAYGNGLAEKASREKLEKYIAYKTYSIFWRNGGAFVDRDGKCTQNEKDVDANKEKCKSELKNLHEELLNEEILGMERLNAIDNYIDENIKILK